MKKSLKLHLDDYHTLDTYMSSNDPTLCSDNLHEYFDFPKDTSDITITLSTEKTKDSYEVKMTEEFNSMQIHHDDNWHFVTMFYYAKKAVSELSDKWEVKSLFVSLDY